MAGRFCPRCNILITSDVCPVCGYSFFDVDEKEKDHVKEGQAKEKPAAAVIADDKKEVSPKEDVKEEIIEEEDETKTPGSDNESDDLSDDEKLYRAKHLCEQKQYSVAAGLLKQIPNSDDAKNLFDDIKPKLYEEAKHDYFEGNLSLSFEEFSLLGDYEDSKSYADELKNRLDEENKESLYQTYCMMGDYAKTQGEYLKAAEGMKSLAGYKDSEERYQRYSLLSGRKNKSSVKPKKKRKAKNKVALFVTLGIAANISVVIFVAVFVWLSLNTDDSQAKTHYEEAKALFDEGRYDEAYIWLKWGDSDKSYYVNFKKYVSAIVSLDDEALFEEASQQIREVGGKVEFVYDTSGGTLKDASDENSLATAEYSGLSFYEWRLDRFEPNSKTYDTKIYVKAFYSYEFGSYIQSVEKDETIIAELNETEADESGSYVYNGSIYEKRHLDGYSSESVTLNNDVKIQRDSDYYFKKEPISWIVLPEGKGSLKLLSKNTIDTACYSLSAATDRVIDGDSINDNNYQYSNVRAWLNGYDGTSYCAGDYTGRGFYDTAFTDVEKTMIQEQNVDNISTSDKAFIPNQEEFEEYSFCRRMYQTCPTTDRLIAIGGTNVSSPYSWWIRPALYSHNTGFLYYNGGTKYGTSYGDHENGVRPCITIKLNP